MAGHGIAQEEVVAGQHTGVAFEYQFGERGLARGQGFSLKQGNARWDVIGTQVAVHLRPVRDWWLRRQDLEHDGKATLWMMQFWRQRPHAARDGAFLYAGERQRNALPGLARFGRLALNTQAAHAGRLTGW